MIFCRRPHTQNNKKKKSWILKRIISLSKAEQLTLTQTILRMWISAQFLFMQNVFLSLFSNSFCCCFKSRFGFKHPFRCDCFFFHLPNRFFFFYYSFCSCVVGKIYLIWSLVHTNTFWNHSTHTRNHTYTVISIQIWEEKKNENFGSRFTYETKFYTFSTHNYKKNWKN